MDSRFRGNDKTRENSFKLCLKLFSFHCHCRALVRLWRVLRQSREFGYPQIQRDLFFSLPICFFIGTCKARWIARRYYSCFSLILDGIWVPAHAQRLRCRVQVVNRFHFHRRQLEIVEFGIGFDPFPVRRFRDGDDAVLQLPAQRDRCAPISYVFPRFSYTASSSMFPPVPPSGLQASQAMPCLAQCAATACWE